MSGLKTVSSESPSLVVNAQGEDGSERQVFYASCYLRENSASLTFEVYDPALVAANMAELQAKVTAFVQESFTRAAARGIPVPAAGE